MGIKGIKIKKRAVSLKTIFIKYLILFCAGSAFLLMAVLIFLSIMDSSGAIISQSYVQKEALKAKNNITQSGKFNSSMIPDLCDYGFYTLSGKIISRSLKENDAKKAWDLVKENGDIQNYLFYYLKVPVKNGVCIIRYPLSPQLTSKVLRRVFHSPEMLGIVLFLIGFIIEAIILAHSFGAKFAKKMAGIKSATEKIKNQDLNFSVAKSGITEIDDVLFSMDKMKEALKFSLNKQWELEASRRQQISSLAHDIKTPLTIVRGNADLLKETNQTDEQIEYTNYITQSASQIENYIKTLLEISRAEIGYVLQKEKISSNKFNSDIHKDINALISLKKLGLDFKEENLPESFSADYELLKRAVMNVVSNAVRYSKQNGTLEFISKAEGGKLIFSVTDCGRGFSNEDLKRADEEFYMGDTSRTSKKHYGMGLYITKSIVKLHGGRLLIANSPKGGGKVTIEIPICI